MDVGKLLSNGLNAQRSMEDYIENVTGSYIVRPSADTGIDGFMFNILDRESIKLVAEATDHYVEDNYSYQDHIALRPEEFTLRGYVGEIADIIPSAAVGVLTTIQSLANIAPFMNTFAVQATQVYSKIAAVTSKVGNILNQVQNIYDIFSGNTSANTKQEKAYAYFYSLWSSRVLVSVTTPYTVLDSMAVVNVEAVQNGNTKHISDFIVTFKKIRVASTRVTTKEAKRKSKLTEAFNTTQDSFISNLKGSGRVEGMMADVVSGGTTPGSDYNALGQAVSTNLLAN